MILYKYYKKIQQQFPLDLLSRQAAAHYSMLIKFILCFSYKPKTYIIFL